MKTFRVHTLMAAVAFLVVCAVSTTHAQDHDAMIAAAAAMDATFAEAFNAGDGDKLASLYWNSPDLVSYPPAKMIEQGFETATNGWKGFLAANPGAELELFDAVHIVAGEYVVSHGLWRMSIPTPDGEMFEMEGRFTDLKKEVDGNWVYVHDHASVPLPPPPAE